MPEDRPPARHERNESIGRETWGLVPSAASGTRAARRLRTVHPDDRANELSLIAEEMLGLVPIDAPERRVRCLRTSNPAQTERSEGCGGVDGVAEKYWRRAIASYVGCRWANH